MFREASLFTLKPPTCLGKVVQAATHHSLHCRDNAGCEANRTIGGDDLRRFACYFQRENGGFLPDSRYDTSGEALIEDG